MSPEKTYTLDEATTLVNDAQAMLGAVQQQLAARREEGPKGPAGPWTFDSIPQALFRLREITQEYEKTCEILRSYAYVATPEESRELKALAQRMGL